MFVLSGILFQFRFPCHAVVMCCRNFYLGLRSFFNSPSSRPPIPLVRIFLPLYLSASLFFPEAECKVFESFSKTFGHFALSCVIPPHPASCLPPPVPHPLPHPHPPRWTAFRLHILNLNQYDNGLLILFFFPSVASIVSDASYHKRPLVPESNIVVKELFRFLSVPSSLYGVYRV